MLAIGSRLFKITFVGAAKGTAPIVWQVRKRGAGVDAAARVTFSRVINVVTDYTTVLGHN